MDFSERLSQLRKERNITQTEFAKIINVSQSTIAMWETRRRDPSSDDIIAIAEYFGVTTDYLLGNSNNPKGTLIEKEEYVPKTIAAHFEGEEYSEEALKDIEKFIEFVKGRDK